MSVLVFPQVLGKGKGLLAEIALKSFDFGVDIIVALKREFGCESFIATWKFTFEHLLLLHEYI